MALDYERLMRLDAYRAEPAYTERDAILYALGIGLGADPLDLQELPFVYERGLRVAPTFAAALVVGGLQQLDLGLNHLMIVHGEQRLTMHKPMPASAALTAESRVVEIVDKGRDKGAVLYVETTLRENSDPIATLLATIFARGDGGFGGPAEGGPAPHRIPARAPDSEIHFGTRPDQALLYRLTGDRNPIHADPQLARAAGFPRPILHGLCTYGMACRAVMQTFCDFDSARVQQFDARFSAPVYPGETVSVRMWRDGDVISFDALVAERGATVLTNGKAVIAP